MLREYLPVLLQVIVAMLFAGSALLAAPHPLLVHHTGEHFSTDDLRAGYKAAGATKHLRIDPGLMTDDAVVKYIISL